MFWRHAHGRLSESPVRNRQQARLDADPQTVPRRQRTLNRPDGTFRDDFTIERGHWEAKDTAEGLTGEITVKINHGYSQTNTIFEHPREARPYQDGKPEMVANKCRVPGRSANPTP
ncbi:MAG: hypothetical protein IID41_10870 [Planctomycetes bacterium]|nr:hypothetical protein [Planctomycetota bacterium]